LHKHAPNWCVVGSHTFVPLQPEASVQGSVSFTAHGEDSLVDDEEHASATHNAKASPLTAIHPRIPAG
jgi:hypothetical protein